MNSFSKKEIYDLKKQERLSKKTKFQKTKKIKRIFVWIFILLAILASVFGLYKLVSLNKSASPNTIKSEILSTDQVRGNIDAPVVLMEYSDFQCSACQFYSSLTKQLYEEFKDEVAFVYRHFPLGQIQDYTQLPATAAEAAGKQGKFWEMHDLLFEKQNNWNNLVNPKNEFINYAKTLGLNTTIFKTDLNSEIIKDKINNNFRAGQEAGLLGTPTFFVNGLPIQNPRTYEEFKAIIELTIQNS